MYPYHNKIKQRISNDELVRYEYVERYKDIAPCLLLHFATEPKIRPIREHRFEEYEALFKQQHATVPKARPRADRTARPRRGRTSKDQ